MRLITKEEEREMVRRTVEHATIREIDKFYLVLQSLKDKQRDSHDAKA